MSKEVEMKPVKSSNIAAIGYDAPSKTMHVQFSSGASYAYDGVEPDIHAAFAGADSVGSHFAKHIRPKFTGRRI